MAKFDFQVDRTKPECLTNQISSDILRAIETGGCAGGDLLPSIRALSARLGVSQIVVRRCYDHLVSEGRIVARKGVGYAVVAGRKPIWCGHVLLVGFGFGENYMSNAISAVLRQRLIENHFLVTDINVEKTYGRGAVSQVLSLALRQTYDLIVSLDDAPRTVAALAKAKTPVLLLYNRGKPHAANLLPVRFRDEAAIEALVGDCLRRKVRSVVQVSFNPTFADARKALRSAGIKVVEARLMPTTSRHSVEQTMKDTARLFERRFATGELPDLFYCNDDYVAMAAVMTLMKRGVRIPEDVRIVSWFNVGQGPVLPVPFARVAFDGYAAGEQLFEMAMSVLKSDVPTLSDVKTVYVKEK